MNIEKFKCALLTEFPFCAGRTSIHIIGFGRIIVLIDGIKEDGVVEIESYLKSILPLRINVTVGDSMEVIKC